MEDKTKYGILLLSAFLTTLFVGYTIGYYKAEKVYGDGWQGCIDILVECNAGYGECVDLLGKCTKQLKEKEVNSKLEEGYDNGWWNTSWSKRYRIEKISGVWVYYTENCTEEQISGFVEGNSSSYDDFSGCFIGRSG